MKKIVILISALLLLTFVSCSDKPEEQPKNKYGLTSEEEALTNLVAEESVACYYSLLTEDGFGNYILAFPTEWREGYQAELEYDDETFDEAIRYATEALHAQRDEDYGGNEYHIEYTFKGERKIEDKELKNLIDELVEFCYMSRDSILGMKAQTYTVHTYAVAGDGTYVNEQTVDEELYFVEVKDEGWYVSPHEFKLP